MNKPHSLNTRAVVALVMFCSFIFLPIAGIALHFTATAPFEPIHHLLMTVHNISALVFLVSALVHLKLNWKPMLNYLKVTAKASRNYRTEMGVAVLIVAIPLLLGVLHVFIRGGM